MSGATTTVILDSLWMKSFLRKCKIWTLLNKLRADLITLNQPNYTNSNAEFIENCSSSPLRMCMGNKITLDNLNIKVKFQVLEYLKKWTLMKNVPTTSSWWFEPIMQIQTVDLKEIVWAPFWNGIVTAEFEQSGTFQWEFNSKLNIERWTLLRTPENEKIWIFRRNFHRWKTIRSRQTANIRRLGNHPAGTERPLTSLLFYSIYFRLILFIQ